MTIMAAVCGVFLVLLGLLTAGRTPTEGQSIIEIVCVVGGLVLCFLAVVLARLKALDRRLDGFEAASAPAPSGPPPRPMPPRAAPPRPRPAEPALEGEPAGPAFERERPQPAFEAEAARQVVEDEPARPAVETAPAPPPARVEPSLLETDDIAASPDAKPADTGVRP